MRTLELTGQQFGKLFVRGRADKNSDRTYWDCVCQCGNTRVVIGRNLMNGHTQSCGCYKVQRIVDTKTTHGCASTKTVRPPEYKVWKGMKDRCSNPNSSGYKRYGARGVRVSKDWEDFGKFFADMGSRPSPLHSIERIDNNKGYEKGNCRWATRVEQCNNRRTNRFLTIDGVTRTVAEWCKHIKVTSSYIYRLSEESALRYIKRKLQNDQ